MRQTNHSVLVVEDEAETRESLSALLTSYGYEAIQAENGAAALVCLKTLSRLPNIILLDMNMPVMNGQQFLKERSIDSILRQVPVVVVSGSQKPASAIKNIAGYLLKPVNVRYLMSIVATFCR